MWTELEQGTKIDEAVKTAPNAREDITINRRFKDSVFRKLFEDKQNILELYKVLHPEDQSVTVADIEIMTLETIIVRGKYNDLGFKVRGKRIILTEAQSTYSLNILPRSLIYVAETLKNHIKDTKQNVFSSEKSNCRIWSCM